MKKPLVNIAASNRAKLLNLSRQTGQSFQELTQYFAMGRFLYRLAVSDVAEKFVLKGAMLLHARHISHARSTLDIDLLGRLDNGVSAVQEAMERVCQQPVDDDGLIFDAKHLVVSEITKEGVYAGRRVNFQGQLGTMQIPMQVDIGFGDSVIPSATPVDTPSMLGYPSAKLNGYALETSIAEKTHAMMKLGLLNSRMKDFYDIWMLSSESQLDDADLVDAIVGTFDHQGTAIAMDSPIFSEEFISSPDKQTQWSAFCRKRMIGNAPEEFSVICQAVFDFLKPVLMLAIARLGGR